ncbi:MAG: type II toxin-antitoxin system VapB family antitoxin [Verrucomicrobiales bacterium]
MNIDDEMLARVMRATGSRNKTETVHAALRDVDRRHRLLALAERGLGMTSAEIKNIFEPDFGVESREVAKGPRDSASKQKRESLSYGRKPRARR